VDFDGDGRVDLLSGSNCCDEAGFHYFRRTENGSWAPRRRLQWAATDRIRLPGTGVHYELFVTAADWNGDGVPDLFCPGFGGESILVALGPFRENEPITPSHEIGMDSRRLGSVGDFATADWDRDGRPDLLVRHSVRGERHGVYWYKNLGGPGLPKLAEAQLVVALSADEAVKGFCAGDWNGDGWPDLIVSRYESMRSNGEGKPVDRGGTVWLYLRE
jgi:hypothetical protein